ncbi:terminase ATPase subunit family protein [Chitinimonas koreensis]|uniref:terminase ATPase subunit family protein n=1 Tax=Chitinimonas koreensis TaxID=356302 RepID=UPI0003F77EA8|nr:terminase ATPase subunit family protein [Chitinimonas koreensis]QNM96379.1 terminase ATPase subunit family protein [Chitinimonas koreensis]
MAAKRTPEPALAPPEVDPRRLARSLYWQGWRIKRIAEHLDLRPATIHSWKRRDSWDETDPIDRVEIALEARIQQLIAKPIKEGGDYKEIDLLGRQVERLARVQRYRSGGNETDLNPKIASRNKGDRKQAERNPISDEQRDELVQAFMDSMFAYQRTWFDAGKHRIRNILKSRQIGATWYFAREAVVDALTTGRNQIFLSASKAQAHQFRAYLCDFVRQTIGVELRGDPIQLPNGAKLHFLGTNFRTAQSYSGNLYLDEYFWIPGFQKLRKVAAGMASHKQWRLTYFSTPSSLSHEAYPFWSGKLFNRGRSKAEQIALDVSHQALAAGRLCEDRQYRQIVTLLDAEAGGCDLFDVDELRFENSAEEFAQLYLCQFIDDGESVFPLAMLQRCMVDSWEVWADFKPFAARPFGNKPVWIGYDPAHTGDSAALVVLAPPAVPGGKFRLLEKHQFKGLDFQAQADKIKRITETYNVAHIGIDTTGIGQGVYQLVKQFFPGVTAYNYSVDVKTRLVLKALHVISHGRFEFDAGATDVAAAFMAIHKTTTASGRHATFEASRSEEVSHADVAWAVMHAMANEPLEGSTPTNRTIMEIIG